jgi:hypothetical protein
MTRPTKEMLDAAYAFQAKLNAAWEAEGRPSDQTPGPVHAINILAAEVLALRDDVQLAREKANADAHEFFRAVSVPALRAETEDAEKRIVELREELAAANQTLGYKAILGDQLITMHVATADGLKQTYPVAPRYSTEAVDALLAYIEAQWEDDPRTDELSRLMDVVADSREPPLESNAAKEQRLGVARPYTASDGAVSTQPKPKV